VAASMWQVRDELWEVVAPLVPVHEPDPRGGRPRVDDRVCFGAIMFVLFTGIAWQHLPRELGCSPATAHRRLKEWQAAGVFAALHRELLRRLNVAGLRRSRAPVSSRSWSRRHGPRRVRREAVPLAGALNFRGRGVHRSRCS
jgi:transposase